MDFGLFGLIAGRQAHGHEHIAGQNGALAANAGKEPLQHELSVRFGFREFRVENGWFKLNGKRLDTWWIRQRDVVRGGTLELELGPQPNEQWAAAGAPPAQSVAPLGQK